jgi:myo-inositol-hexaphosphate 3-phosphohydrolase
MSTLHLKALELGLDAVLALGTPKLSFMTVAHTPNAGTQQYYSDISANVASGTSVVTLAGVTTTIDTGNARVEFDTSDITQSSITASTNKYAIWVDTTNPATSPVLATIDIAEGTLSPVSGTLTITVNAEGHFALKAV